MSAYLRDLLMNATSPSEEDVIDDDVPERMLALPRLVQRKLMELRGLY